jgi:tellurite methyltransferase
MQYYDSIYKNSKNFCGARPNRLLVKITKNLKKAGEFLDLGCGQGRDSFYMSRHGFKVTAVDSSRIAINQINNCIKQKKIIDFAAECKNIKNFTIKPSKFNIIAATSVLQFLAKKDSLNTIEKIKKNISRKGLIVLTSFTAKNLPSKRRKSYFESGEMKGLFPKSKFKILYYFEGTIKDSGHIGAPGPHYHGIVEIIARKK